MINKLLAAQSAEEVAAIVKAADREIAPEDIPHLWDEIGRRREQKTLSPDELEAVSGGDADRDWLEDGCAASVEPNSWCWTNAMCYVWDIVYSHQPCIAAGKCPRCGGYMCYDVYRPEPLLYAETYLCRACGYRRNTVFPDWEY